MEKQLYCGAAKVDITPSAELLPWMFGLMGQQYGRVHDPLHLRVLALGDGENKALIVVYDLDKATNPVEWTGLLAEKTGIPVENILYLAIHTHTGPLTGYRPFEGPNFIERKPVEVQEKVHAYEAFLKERLLQAAEEAVAAMVPAKMGYATGRCHIGRNRCQRYDVKGADGQVQPEMNIGVDPEGIADPTMLVARFEDAATGKPIAFLTNYAVHCVAVFRNVCADGKAFLSADIAGAVSTELEREYPGSVALWTSAPAGDINPAQMVQTFCPDAQTGTPVERCIPGEEGADIILAAMANRQLAAIRQVLQQMRCELEQAPLSGAIQWAKTHYAADGFFAEEPVFDRPYEIRTHLLQIGPLALIGVDGELYTSLGQAMKAASPVKDTFIINHECSLLENNPGYIMDDAMAEKLRACGGRGSQRGGIPGGGIYTRPGAVKTALTEATRALFRRDENDT